METKLNLTDLLNILDNTESEEAKDLLETINDLDKKRSNLKNRCRLDFKVYLRDMLLKDRCELCGTTENLILHHEKSFSKMIDETINEVGMENIQLFRQVMLAKQIMTNSITLCEECHKEVHRENGGFSGSNKESEIAKIIAYGKKKRNQSKEEKKTADLEYYLRGLIGKQLYKRDKNRLIKKLDVKDNRGRQQKSIHKLNTNLNENFNLTLVSKRNNCRNSEKYKKTYWELVKLTEENIN